MSDMHEYDENRTPSLEEKLTAYLLDELSTTDREAVEKALAEDSTLVAKLEELSATVNVLRAQPATAGLSADRRDALRSAAAAAGGASATAAPPAAPPRGRVFYMRRAMATAAVVAIAATLAIVGDYFGGNRMGLAPDTSYGTLSAHARRAEQQLAKSDFVRQDDGTWKQRKNQMGYLGGDDRAAGRAGGLTTLEALNEIGYAGKAVDEIASQLDNVDRDALVHLGYMAESEEAAPGQLLAPSEMSKILAEAPGVDAALMSEAPVGELRFQETFLNELGYVDSVDNKASAAGAYGEKAQDGSRSKLKDGNDRTYTGPGDVKAPRIDVGDISKFPFNEARREADIFPPLAEGGNTRDERALGELKREGMAFDTELMDQLIVPPAASAQPQVNVLREAKPSAGSQPEIGARLRSFSAPTPATPGAPTSAVPSSPAATPGREAELGLRAAPREQSQEAPNRFSRDGEEGDLAFDFSDSFHDDRRQPVLECYDGYGRRYHDDEVFGHLRRKHKEAPRDMFFRFYGDNPAVRASEDALSTFAADVDTASYPLVRKYLVDGNLPPRSAVRTEEFLNYFNNDLTAPKEGDFAVNLEYHQSPFGGSPRMGMVKVGIKGREVSRADRKQLNLVFVIDKSGSMKSGNRMNLVKRSLGLLIDQLDDNDTVGIVTFDTSGHRVLPPTAAYERWVIREAVNGLHTGGSTNAEAGLLLGYEMIEQSFKEGAVNRIVLCSDGVANTGETDQERILERVRSFSEREVDLTAIGVGMGNHNDVFLEQIANKGNGSCHYVDDFDEAKRVFVDQFTGTLQTIARDMKIQVEFDPTVVVKWRQLGYENRAIADKDFRNDSVDAGEIGAGHEIVALYEVEIRQLDGDYDPTSMNLAAVRLRWRPDGENKHIETEHGLSYLEVNARSLPSPRFRMSVVAAQFAEVLRRSYWARGDSYDQLMAEAATLANELNEPQVRELRDMIHRTKRLIDRLPPYDELAQLVDEARRLRIHEAELDEIAVKSDEVEKLLEKIRDQNKQLDEKIQQLIEQNR